MKEKMPNANHSQFAESLSGDFGAVKKIILLLFLICATGGAFAQETARERLGRETQQNAPATNRSIRAAQMTRAQNQTTENARWLRVVYRYLDLSKEANASLYYPVTPTDGRANLFTLIFRLLQNNTIAAYEYLDGREIFTDEYRVDFREFLDRFGVYYTTNNGNIELEDVDIPNNEVLGYFVKEAYYFDSGTSAYGVQTLALCPVIHRMGDYDATTTRYPLFWVDYESIRPYTMRAPVMASALNNTMSGTIDDFFRKRNYDGEIYKAANPRNLAISQYTATPEERKAEQEKIERELKEFESQLWKSDSSSKHAGTAKPTEKKRRNTATVNTMRNRRY